MIPAPPHRCPNSARRLWTEKVLKQPKWRPQIRELSALYVQKRPFGPKCRVRVSFWAWIWGLIWQPLLITDNILKEMKIAVEAVRLLAARSLTAWEEGSNPLKSRSPNLRTLLGHSVKSAAWYNHVWGSPAQPKAEVCHFDWVNKKWRNGVHSVSVLESRGVYNKF